MSEHSKAGDVHVYEDGEGLCIAIVPRDNDGVVHITPTRIHICEDADYRMNSNYLDLKVFSAEDLRTMIIQCYADKIKEEQYDRISF